MKVVGLMSGTSADGIDAVLLEVEDAAAASPAAPEATRHPTVRQLTAVSHPWPAEVAERLGAAMADQATTSGVAHLRQEVSEGFATATRALLEVAGVEPDAVAAVGCHGQTVWHRPPGERQRGASRSGGRHRGEPRSGEPRTADGRAGDEERPGTSLQLLDSALLAARTGVPVVSDFRSADLAAGGEGAPLVSFSDPILFAGPDGVRALLNWGGIANVTRVPPRRRTGATSGGSSADTSPTDPPPLAFDLGPANALIDAAVQLATSGRETFDEDGARAAAGEVDDDLLRDLMADPWLDRTPPKSTGKERYGAPWVRELAETRGLRPDSPPAGWNDFIRTLAEFTVRSTAYGIERFLGEVDEVLVAGGGARNPVLLAGLENALAPIPVRVLRASDGPSGVDATTREAAAFALLAWAFLRGRPGNVPEATGADGPRVLGSFTPAPGRSLPWHPR